MEYSNGENKMRHENTTNLLEETLSLLIENDKSPDDIITVIFGDFYTNWEQFAEVVADVNYDSGYGTEEINQNIFIVGKNFWLERHQYDGSEWWEFKTTPTRENRTPKVITIKDIDGSYDQRLSK